MALSCVMAFSLAACAGQPSENDSAMPAAEEETPDVVGADDASGVASTDNAPDYSKEECWYQIPEITKDVDTFFVYPTEYLADNESDPDYAAYDDPAIKDGVDNLDHRFMASVYEDSTNVFMPYYRQASLRVQADAWRKTGDVRNALKDASPYADITAALDYYFENYNNGRPFILAAHSQGSAICSLVLENYFKEHPEYYERMVAAYIIGFSVTKDDLEANPHLKFATGESDTGVIISWNTEGPKNIEENAPNAVLRPNAICINPLNWKLDDTYAPASENLGSLVLNEETNETEISDIGADAQIVPERGVIVTNADYEPMTGMDDVFGSQSFHNGDYTFYYNNIKDNVAKRIAAYMDSDNKIQGANEMGLESKIVTSEMIKTLFHARANGQAPEELLSTYAADAPDYSLPDCWLQIPEITKGIDTFYVYSTVYVESSFEDGAPDYATLDNPEMQLGALGEYATNASVYEDSTNVFVPYYRQSGMRYANEVSKKTGDIDAALSGISYDDISAALDYYFENCNGGRPFIIAGHSQGSAMVKYVLKNYFKKHPEYYARMVAAYVIGFSVTKEDLEANPHLKFASGESDTGVTISYNTEGPKSVEENAHNVVVLPGAISINPLNWKRDETYASASENLGSYLPNAETEMYEITDVGADAKVVLSRGVIVTNTTYDQYAAAEFFGPQSFHEDDYTLYYNNIKDNVAKRIAAYQAGE